MALALAIVMTILSFLGLGRIGAMATGVGSLIFLPISALIGSFIAAAILYVVWKLMGSEEPYETSYRCVPMPLRSTRSQGLSVRCRTSAPSSEWPGRCT
jgi:hypothetical protein